jgi:hypothetical protein
MGSPAVTLASPYLIAGCTLATNPCTGAKHVTFTTRVTSMGQPLLLMDSQAPCAPNGTPLIVSWTQPRVFAF